jgi:hypothetical protein
MVARGHVAAVGPSAADLPVARPHASSMVVLPLVEHVSMVPSLEQAEAPPAS